MVKVRTRVVVFIAVIVLAMAGGSWMTHIWAESGRDPNQKVGLALRVSPAMAFSPVRVSAVAELKGTPQPDDFMMLYCAAVEWDWDDGTRSEVETDCDPYEDGKSELQRRYTAQHTYTESGRFQIQLRLKRNDRVLLTTNSSIRIRPGA